MSKHFTIEDFCRTASEFREAMGTKSFWQLPKKNRDGAKRSVTFVYLSAQMDTEEFEKVGDEVVSLLREYAQRETFLEAKRDEYTDQHPDIQSHTRDHELQRQQVLRRSS